MPRRTALVLVVAVAAFLAAWGATRLRKSDRAPLPAPAEAPPPAARSPWPADPAGFVAWLRTADAAARTEAAASARDGGSKALVAAVVDALDGETTWAWEFLESVGPAAVEALEARCLRWDADAAAAFTLVMELADPAERQRFLAICLAQPVATLRGEAARWIPGGETSYPLRVGLARALVTTESRSSALGGIYDALAESVRSDEDSLLALLAEADADVRAGAMQTVLAWVISGEDYEAGVVNPRVDAAVNVCARLLSDPDERVRRSAIRTLGLLGNQWKVTVPADPILATLANGSEIPEVRAAAARTLASLHVDAAVLRPYLHDPSPVVRATVLDSLKHDDPSQVREARSLLSDPDATVREAAADALRWSPFDPETRARLKEGLDDPDESVRIACCRALWQEGQPPVEALAHLERWLSDGSDAERDVALEMVAPLGPKAAPLDTALVGLLDGPDPKIRSRALKAMEAVPGTDPRALEALIACAGDPEWSVRLTAVPTLIRRFPDHPAALDSLRERLSDEDSDVAASAAAHLVAYPAHRAAALAACARVVGDGNAVFWARQKAIEAIGRCGRDSREAVQAILDVLDDPPSHADDAIVDALAALPELRDVTVPVLVRKAADGNELALRALDKLGAEARLTAALEQLPPEQRAGFDRAWAEFQARLRRSR